MPQINFEQLIATLRHKLTLELPGLQAQLKMATLRRLKEPQVMEVPENAGIAAVLVLFYMNDSEPELAMIERTDDGGVHSGQIAFPGGRQEKGDVDIIDTALRETHEEIGIKREEIQILGKLSNLYIPPSNFHVSPVVGYMHHQPRFDPDPTEVANVLQVKLSDLLDEKTMTQKPLEIKGTHIEVPCYYIDGRVIWGATAMIISELLSIIRS